jgi:sulfate transport system substrate-binding protein
MRNLFIALATAAGLALSSVARAEDVTLTFVSYAVAKPVYAKIIPAFKKQYKAATGNDVTFKESYGPSGAQNRSIVGGLEADVLATNSQMYVDDLVKADLVKSDWATRVPNGGSPATSVIVAITRAGNPKNIKTWTDIAADGVQIVAINPKTSGNARWGVLAGYAALKNGDDTKAAEAYVQGLVKNTKTLVAGGREATDAFVKNGVGDVLLTFENEAKFAAKSGQNLPYVTPETNIRTDFPVAVLDKNVDKHNTRAAAEAFVKFLFSPEAQQFYADAGYRPSDTNVKTEGLAEIKKLITIDDVGGWPTVEKALFADGALYDQALAAVKK